MEIGKIVGAQMNNELQKREDIETEKRNPLKSFLILLGGIIGLIYLVNPTAGLFELLPDNIPVIGNLDEAAATILFLGALRYFGLDLTKIFKKNIPKK